MTTPGINTNGRDVTGRPIGKIEEINGRMLQSDALEIGGAIYQTCAPAQDHDVPPSMECDGMVQEAGCFLHECPIYRHYNPKYHPGPCRACANPRLANMIGSNGQNYIQVNAPFGATRVVL